MMGRVAHPELRTNHRYRRCIDWTPSVAQSPAVLEMAGRRCREERKPLNEERHFHQSHRRPVRLLMVTGVAA